jgi:mRNA deadenylase 3'-5' endonuclease subunit Ccr4
VIVDYIFYSTVRSEKYNGTLVEGDLKLVSRAEHINASEIGLSTLPNEKFPSDHVALLAKFVLTS